MDIRQICVAELARWGIAQGDLARMAGVSQSDLSRYLRGRVDWSGAKLGRLLAALGLAVVPSASLTGQAARQGGAVGVPEAVASGPGLGASKRGKRPGAPNGLARAG